MVLYENIFWLGTGERRNEFVRFCPRSRSKATAVHSSLQNRTHRWPWKCRLNMQVQCANRYMRSLNCIRAVRHARVPVHCRNLFRCIRRTNAYPILVDSSTSIWQLNMFSSSSGDVCPVVCRASVCICGEYGEINHWHNSSEEETLCQRDLCLFDWTSVIWCRLLACIHTKPFSWLQLARLSWDLCICVLFVFAFSSIEPIEREHLRFTVLLIVHVMQ